MCRTLADASWFQGNRGHQNSECLPGPSSWLCHDNDEILSSGQWMRNTLEYNHTYICTGPMTAC
ncbi:hypothetical protein AALO_G00266130 [Alosa alosa]|uniref:Uncharacterized protein n=1 Tax=Alosa alosa TaxID=278164 RepID=A0AAV6FM35_9TELE|nr:hypothetical protein AALO_G00266130 [Alosa alosa]